MGKILFVAHVDLKKRNGAGLATLAYYNAVKSLYGDNVDLMMPKECAFDDSNNIIKVPRRSVLQAILSGSPHRFKQFLNNYLNENKGVYDVCVLNGGLYSGDMMKMIHRYGLKIIVIHHNLEREYHIDNKSIFTLKGITPAFVNMLEKKAYTQADVNCFLTKDDRLLFEKCYGPSLKPVHILGVFEPVPNNLPFLSGNLEQKTIAITGSMDSVQTIRGLNDFRDNYLDVINTSYPDWRLIIAGRNPQKVAYEIVEKAPTLYKVIANPENMDDVTKKASVFLCPTNVGGGLKLRVMDGLRSGLPVLVHRVSSRGYDSFRGKPFFKVYSDHNTFAKGLKEIVSFCETGISRQDIQNEYLKIFSFESGCERIKNVFNDLKNS